MVLCFILLIEVISFTDHSEESTGLPHLKFECIGNSQLWEDLDFVKVTKNYVKSRDPVWDKVKKVNCDEVAEKQFIYAL